jgi:hypothetical protein
LISRNELAPLGAIRFARSEQALFRGDRLRLEIDAQRLRDAGAIRGIGFGAVGDMALLDFDARVTHGAGGVLEENPLLLGGHLPEQDAGLLIVIIIDAMVPIGRSPSIGRGGSISASFRSIHEPLLLGQ